jgi:plastocyanin domain-containing protein
MTSRSWFLFALVALPLGLAACRQKPEQAPSDDVARASASPAVLSRPGASAVAAEGLRQTVTVDGEGFHPATLHAHAGQNVTLVFRRVTDATCAKQVVFSESGVRKDLPLGEDVAVTVVAKGPEVKFACGMDMLKGTVVVEP